MRHIGNSGRLAMVAALAAAGLLVLTAITFEEVVLFSFLGAVAVGYLACVVEVVARGRNLALLAGGLGTSLFIGFAIAFLRMWGLAFTAGPESVGAAVTTQDSDVYFYLAALSGAGTLLVLFAGAVWPVRKRHSAGRSSYGRVPASRSGATRAPAPKSGAPRTSARKSAPPKSPAKAASRR